MVLQMACPKISIYKEEKMRLWLLEGIDKAQYGYFQPSSDGQY